MSRSLLAMTFGTLLAGGAIAHAAAGAWSSSGTLIAQADPPPPPKNTRPPAAPPSPARPAAPPPPAPPAMPGMGPIPGLPPGVSVSINNGKISVSGVGPLVEQHLAEARKRIASDPNIPKATRDKILAKMDKTQAIVKKRLANVQNMDIDDIGEEMEKMGAEIEKEMAGLEDEMAKLGESMAKLHGLDLDFDFDFDADDIPSSPMSHGSKIDDDDDMRDAINDLKDLAVKPAQRDAITKLRTDSDKTVTDAKKKLDDLSSKLEVALGNAQTPDAEIGKLVDQISAQEAVIRKARIVAWAQARRVLDENQRKKIESKVK